MIAAFNNFLDTFYYNRTYPEDVSSVLKCAMDVVGNEKEKCLGNTSLFMAAKR